MTVPTKRECVRVGCQGWNYDDWVTPPASGKGVFYPQGTRTNEMLTIYAQAFETVEVDSTFYAVPSISTIDGWIKRTPPKFTFSLKLPQEITHQYGLRRGSANIVAEFCERARQLDEKLGVVLVQLPPQFEATPENIRTLQEFLKLLPRDLRFSVEFRHGGWLQESVIESLAHHHVALTLVEGQWIARERMWDLAEKPTADFAYVRWMGARDLVRFDMVQRPQEENLRAWRDVITRLYARAPNVYAYFSNYYEGHAPASANKLKRLLGQATIGAADLEDQPSLF